MTEKKSSINAEKKIGLPKKKKMDTTESGVLIFFFYQRLSVKNIPTQFAIKFHLYLNTMKPVFIWYVENFWENSSFFFNSIFKSEKKLRKNQSLRILDFQGGHFIINLRNFLIIKPWEGGNWICSSIFKIYMNVMSFISIK